MKNKIISLMLYVFVFSSFLFCEEFKFTVTKTKNWKSIVGTDKVINKGDEYYTKGNNGFGFHYRNDSSLIEL